MADDLIYTLVVKDNGTAVIKKVTQTAREAGVAGEEVGRRTARGAKEAAEGISQLERTLSRIQRTAAAFLALWVGREVVGGISGMLSKAMEFNSTIEDSRLGIASILVASGEFTNSIGRNLTGWDKMNAALEMSSDLIEQIKVKNLETFATLEQIVKAYQSGLAFGLQRGIDPRQMLNYTVAMVQAAGALRMNLDMMAEEMRSLMTGAISPRTSFIATALRITPEDIRKYQNDVAGLMGFITEKLSAFQYAGILGQKTWTGLISNVKDAIANVLGTGFQSLFDYIKEQLAGTQGYVVRINEATGKMELNPQLLSDLKEVSKILVSILQGVKDTASWFGNWIPFLTAANEILKFVWSGISPIVWLLEQTGKSINAWLGLIAQGYREITGLIGEVNRSAEKVIVSDATKQLEQRLADYINKGGAIAYRPKGGETFTSEQLDAIAKLKRETMSLSEEDLKRVQLLMKQSGQVQDISTLYGDEKGKLVELAREYDKATSSEEKRLLLVKAGQTLTNMALDKEKELLSTRLKLEESIAQYTKDYSNIETIQKAILENELAQEKAKGKLTPAIDEVKRALLEQQKLSKAMADLGAVSATAMSNAIVTNLRTAEEAFKKGIITVQSYGMALKSAKEQLEKLFPDTVKQRVDAEIEYQRKIREISPEDPDRQRKVQAEIDTWLEGIKKIEAQKPPSLFDIPRLETEVKQVLDRIRTMGMELKAEPIKALIDEEAWKLQINDLKSWYNSMKEEIERGTIKIKMEKEFIGGTTTEGMISGASPIKWASDVEANVNFTATGMSPKIPLGDAFRKIMANFTTMEEKTSAMEATISFAEISGDLRNLQKKYDQITESINSWIQTMRMFSIADLTQTPYIQMLKGLQEDIQYQMTPLLMQQAKQAYLMGIQGAEEKFYNLFQTQYGFPNYPSYQHGTSYVPRTGLAYIHQGEKITPANDNRVTVSGVQIYVDGSRDPKIVAKEIAEILEYKRDGRLEKAIQKTSHARG